MRGYRIEAPMPSWPAWPHRLLRVSAHLYNTLDQYQNLADALDAIGRDRAPAPALD
jgi:selenocysteine lyase/cysteine desulfurase